MYGFEFSSQSQNSPELSSAQNCFKMTLTIANIIFLVRRTIDSFLSLGIG